MGQGRSRSREEHGSEMEVVPGNGPPLTTLCEDVLLEIASCCDVKTLGRLRQTCRHMNTLLESPLLWTRKANTSFNALDKQWRTIARRCGVRSLSACPLRYTRVIPQRHSHSRRLKFGVERDCCFVYTRHLCLGNQRKPTRPLSIISHPPMLAFSSYTKSFGTSSRHCWDVLGQGVSFACVVSA